MRDSASDAVAWAAAWAVRARETSVGSALGEEASGCVRAREVESAMVRAAGVRKWLRRGGSASGRERTLLVGAEVALPSEFGVEMDVVRSAEKSSAAAEAVAGTGSAVSKDSRKGVGIPRMGSPSAAARSWRSTVCRAMLAARRASACLFAYGSRCRGRGFFGVWPLAAAKVGEVLEKGRRLGRRHRSEVGGRWWQSRLDNRGIIEMFSGGAFGGAREESLELGCPRSLSTLVREW